MIAKGDLLVAYSDRRPKDRLYVSVMRVAKDGAWADIRVCTWAVMWTKRMPLSPNGMPPACKLMAWSDFEMVEQEADHLLWLEERRQQHRPELP